MSFELNNNSLLNFLKQKDLDAKLQKETDQVYIELKIEELVFPLFFVIFEESKLLQTLAYVPYELNSKRLGDTARLLHLINKQLDVPGFGMDEKEGVVFYRAVLPCFDGKVDGDLLGMHLAMTRLACETFVHPISVVATGAVTFEELIKEEHKGSNG